MLLLFKYGYQKLNNSAIHWTKTLQDLYQTWRVKTSHQLHDNEIKCMDPNSQPTGTVTMFHCLSSVYEVTNDIGPIT